MSGYLLEVEDLTVAFASRDGTVLANDGVSLSLRAGETLGIVGESGSGKSVLCRAILGLAKGKVTARRIAFDGRNIDEMSPAERQKLRGSGIAMVFQSPMSSIDPVWTIGDQLVETVRLHKPISRRQARIEAAALLDRVGIASSVRRLDDYPHQWSGGMLQRAVIALALAGNPRLILADEPTTALDVTIQDQILALLMSLQRETGMAMIIVSHDLSVIAETVDRVAVMYAGRIVEVADVQGLFQAPQHPYTAGLFASIVGGSGQDKMLTPIPGQPPDLQNLPAGCAFAPRCPRVRQECLRSVPRIDATVGRSNACLFPLGDPLVVRPQL